MRNKYNAKKTKVNGKTCDSMLEARHYNKLLLLEKNGKILDLQFHPRFPLHANGIKIGVCELDFSYIIGNTPYYIDSKGVYTAFSKWKHKHFTAEYGFPVEIWRK